MAEDWVTEGSDMSQVQQDDGVPLVDPSILKDKRVMLVRDLDVDTVFAGLKPFLQYNHVDSINAETNRGTKTGMLIDIIQRMSYKQYTMFNALIRIIGGLQPDLFVKLVGRAPSENESDFCVKKYVDNLKECIKGQGHSTDCPLDEEIEFGSEYVQLAIVRDKLEPETFHDLPHRHQASRSNVQDRKDNVPIVEVLNSNHTEDKPKRVLLYGQAGTGKTTTFQWLAREWSFNRWATQFTILFFLQLRLLSVSDRHMTTLEMLTMAGLYQVTEADLVCLVSSWLKNSGTKLLILLDGLNEISGFSARVKNCQKIYDLNQKAHPIDICINILLGNLLPRCTVIVASSNFPGVRAIHFNKAFEVLGLTEACVKEFVEKKHPNKAAHIMSVLRTSPLLMSISGITFYCALISRLLTDGVVFNNQELETYTRLTAFILVQYVSRKLSEWPFVVEVSSYFPELACMAYNGIFETQLNGKVSKFAFDEYDLSKAKLTPQRLKSVLEVGLLQTKKLRSHLRNSVTAEFFHSSIQQMLASAYLLTHFDCTGDIFKQVFSEGQFNMALLYLFGLQYDTGSAWVKDIRHSVDASGQRCNSDTDIQMEDVIQHLCEKCEKNDDFSSKLHLCQVLHEGQMEDKARDLVRYIISSQSLCIKSTPITIIDLMAVRFVCKFQDILTRVSLTFSRVTDTLMDYMASSVLVDHVKALQELDLRNNEMGADGAKATARWILQSHTLQTLNVSENNIGEAGARALADALHQNNNLQTLLVDGNNIGDNGATAIAEALHQNKALQLLGLSDNSVGEKGTKALAEVLRWNSTLQTLDVGSNNIDDDGAIALAKAIQHNNGLQVLDVSSNEIGDAGLEALRDVEGQDFRIKTYTGGKSLRSIQKWLGIAGWK